MNCYEHQQHNKPAGLNDLQDIGEKNVDNRFRVKAYLKDQQRHELMKRISKQVKEEHTKS